MARVAVIRYSATGHVHRLAEHAPTYAVAANPAWAAHAAELAGLTMASLDDLPWADDFAFGTPSRFGTPAAQLKQFIDTTGGLWAEGVLTNKPVTVFTSANNPSGGSTPSSSALDLPANQPPYNPTPGGHHHDHA